MRTLIRLSILLLLCVLFALLGATLDIYLYAHQTVGVADARTVVTIRPGEPFSEITAGLVNRGVVTHPVKFRFLARVTGHDKQIRAGEFQLTTGRTPLQILEQLATGKAILHRVTIPEGYTLAEIARVVAAQGLVTEKAFIGAATDPAAAEKYCITAPTLEGYLFPDTYYFPRTVSAPEIVEQMVRRFWETFTPQWQERAQDLGMGVHGIVTLASIIEKETGAGRERPLIASVFWNRMKRKMRLESDPTVIYGIDNFDGNLTRNHLRTPTPYNTYVIKGLPPGPIANPGAKSIEAALFPAVSDYIFFVAKKDGTHHFSVTYNAHRRAVKKYQLAR